MCDTDADIQRAWLALTTGKTRFEGWCRTQVLNILRNPLYRGQWQYGKTKSQHIDTPGKVKRIVSQKAAEDETILTVAVPATVPLELWSAAQEQLEENKRNFMHPPVHAFVLRGRLRCAECGTAMMGHSFKKYTETGEVWYRRYYRCRPSRTELKTEVNYLQADN